MQRESKTASKVGESGCSFAGRPSFVVLQFAMLYQLNARHRRPLPRLGNRLKDYCNGVRMFEIPSDKIPVKSVVGK
jgi:hypothetical protein